MQDTSTELIKSCDSLDPNLRYVEGQSQYGLNDSPKIKPKQSIMTTSDLPANESLQKLGSEYQFRLIVFEAQQIPIEYEDIFCQFNFLHQHHEAYSTEPIKNTGNIDMPLVFSHMQNVNHNKIMKIRLLFCCCRVFLVQCDYYQFIFGLFENKTDSVRNSWSLSRTIKSNR